MFWEEGKDRSRLSKGNKALRRPSSQHKGERFGATPLVSLLVATKQLKEGRKGSFWVPVHEYSPPWWEAKVAGA